MLTDRQSIILSAIVIVGFVLSGIFQILNNYIVIGTLVVCFLIVVVNIFINKDFLDTTKEDIDKDSAK